LTPSEKRKVLARPELWPAIDALRSEFRRGRLTLYLGPGGSIPADTLFVRLAVAQHHRLPTRVLDWTVSPKVASHFATAGGEHYDKDGVVWCLDVRQVRDLLPVPLQNILKDELAFLFSVEMLPDIKSLKDLDAFGTRHGSFALFYEPPSLDARIVNQRRDHVCHARRNALF
jgi:hypothetical protein